MSTDQKQQKLQIRIKHDPEPINWREEGEPVGKMVYTSTRYKLGDERVDDPIQHMADQITDPEQRRKIDGAYGEPVENYARIVQAAFDKEFVSLPVYAYIHDSVTISTGQFSCPWDSGQCGIIYAKRNNPEFEGDDDELVECLEAEVKSFDRYLRGDVWGFETYKVETCEHGHEHEEVVDSCWGFGNTDDEDDMVAVFKDYVGDDATEEQIRKAWQNRE